MAHDHAELDRLLDLVLNTRDIKRGFERLDLFWARLAMHIRAEHLHLFPAIRKALGHSQEKDAPSLNEAEVIATPRSDHDYFMVELAGAVALLRQLKKVDTTTGWRSSNDSTATSALQRW